jgi:hypothetical protein
MGATGCGKSTLINGMVNYILGVKWNDPFRFKCVRDDETTAKYQAHSQTRTVTAYTLHHHNGMAVPYSITIIDTPGYGDTRGVQWDKEITRKIHQFLTQPETRVDEIHAACFVAASGNSRLTPTQSYIIDSVLSIFGKDVKENIRLLVTFADNAHPPVVKACLLAANFPVPITFSKFNSSVLYANNEHQGEDDFCFDELFWDMGQENFHIFFTMLEKMNGKDLKSTRNVIQSRELLEQSLKDIEQELEVCFVKIENIEIFQRKMREYGHRMESNKNFTFEKTEMRLYEMLCEKGYFAYNCRRCGKTCGKPNKLKYSERLQKRRCEFCTCPASEHEYQTFEWRLTPVKITTTLKDMKAEYESNYDRKISVEQLLADNLEELNVAKAKVFSLLEQVGINARSLESTALRSNALTPSDYISMMRSRVAEEQAPGYLTRLETLTELQNSLAADASASASHTRSIPNQTHRLSKTDGTTHKVNYGFTTSQHSQHGNNADDYGYGMATTNTAGVSSNYSSEYHTGTVTSPSLNQYNNQSVMTRQGTAKCDSLQTLKTHGLHRGDKLSQWNSTIPRDNCWKENVTDKQAGVYKHDVPKGATKAANRPKFSAVYDDYDVQLQFVKQSLKVSGKELATTQQEISDKIEIKSNAAAITGSADAGQDLIVHKIEQMKVHDVAEGRPSLTACTAADFIQKSSAVVAAGRKQTNQHIDRNDRDNIGGAFISRRNYGIYSIGNYGSKTSQYSQQGTVDGYRMASTNTAGASINYSSGYHTRTASSRGLDRSNNQSAMTRREAPKYDSPANQKLKHGWDSKEGYSSNDNKDKKGFAAFVKDFLFE